MCTIFEKLLLCKAINALNTFSGVLFSNYSANLLVTTWEVAYSGHILLALHILGALATSPNIRIAVSVQFGDSTSVTSDELRH
jgi:hypothetical protein